MIADTCAALEPSEALRPRRRSDRVISGIAVIILAVLGLGFAGSCIGGALAATALNRKPTGNAGAEPSELLALLRPYPPSAMRAYPVSTVVNSPKNDTSECFGSAA